jgi:hypothetical protein
MKEVKKNRQFSGWLFEFFSKEIENHGYIPEPCL